MLQAGTTEGAINECIKMFTTANTRCPDTVIVAGGYRYVNQIRIKLIQGVTLSKVKAPL
jgi:hypothetical protein